MTRRATLFAVAGFTLVVLVLVAGLVSISRKTIDSAESIVTGRASEVREILRSSDLTYRPLSDLTSLLSGEDLPILLSLLTDESAQDFRYKTLIVIAYFGRGDEVARELVDFVKRPETLHTYFDSPKLDDKANAIEYLGIVGGPIAQEVLVAAATEQGAWNLAAGWWNDVHPDVLAHQMDFFLTMRYRAARGLAYTKDPAHNRIIEFMYADALSNARQIVEKYEDQTLGLSLCSPKERSIVDFYVEMAWVLAIRDTINAIGLESYLPRIFSMNFPDPGYLKKYEVLELRYAPDEPPPTTFVAPNR